MRELKFYDGNKQNVVIPEGIKAILVDDFHYSAVENGISPDRTLYFKESDLWDVETIDMPDSVVLIGPKAFQSCRNLKKVNFSKKLKKICIYAFSGASQLKSITLPKSLKIIDTWAFGNYGLADIFYDGTIFDFDKIDTRGAFLSIERLHCSDCTVDFTRKDFYIDELKYDSTMEVWKNKMSSHWLNRRSEKIICSDGEIQNQKL